MNEWMLVSTTQFASWKGISYFIISNYWGAHKKDNSSHWAERDKQWVIEPLSAHWSPDAQVQLHHAPVVFVCVISVLFICVMHFER